MRKLALYFCLVLMVVACKEQDEPEPLAVEEVQAANVIVLNEGNFQWANASLSLYNEESRKVDNKVFQKNNNNLPLGDVVQSMVQIGDLGYFVINNSNKIRVLNLNTFRSEGAIENLNSPRYILPISAQKAYVSDLHEDKIYVVDLSSQSILKTIPTQGWTEEMVLLGDKAFVCQMDSNEVLVFDTKKDSLLQRISTYTSPQYIEVDVNQDVWVSCSGSSNSLAALQKIDANQLQVVRTMAAQNTNESIGEIELSPQKNKLYYLTEKGMNQLSVTDSILPTQPWIASAGRNLYGLSVNPQNGEIYLCDAIDFQQEGVVYRYGENGSLIDQFQVGIIPGDVYFKQ
ncbi:MAG: hypothetical protein RIC95_10845 [Vicingaceae bacterium]